MLILIGKTCSGKDLIRDKLVSEFGLRLKKEGDKHVILNR